MKHVLTCLVVALACTFFLTYPTYAEEVREETEILDFSGASKNGDSDDVVVRSIPIIPGNDSLNNEEEKMFAPILRRLLYWTYDENGNIIYDGSGSGNSFHILKKAVNLLVFIVPSVVACVFFWWGLRKTVSAIMSAFKRGKLRL